MMLRSKLLNVLLALQIIIAATAQGQSRPAPHESKPLIDLTSQQIALCKLNDEFLNWHAPPPETNTIRMATAAPTREPDWNGRLQNILGDGMFTNWNVIIYSFLVNEYKEISINVEFVCPVGIVSNQFRIKLSTSAFDHMPWPHQRSKFPPTDPKLGSEFSNFLSARKPGDKIQVSGKIFFERRYLDQPLFPVTYPVAGRQSMGAQNLVVRFDKMTR